MKPDEIAADSPAIPTYWPYRSVSTIIRIGVSLSSTHIMDSVGIPTIGDSPS
jgi:hypothetical protein